MARMAHVAPLRMLDLFAGLGGASAAMRARGWQVVTVEVDPRFRPDVVADVRQLPIHGHFDLVWASPPCTEFSREAMPWCRTGRAPAMDLVFATLCAVNRLKPRWWVMENVRGAQRWFGRAPAHYGPVYLWGWYPPFRCDVKPWKEKLSSTADAARAKIPYELSEALAIAVEREHRKAA